MPTGQPGLTHAHLGDPLDGHVQVRAGLDGSTEILEGAPFSSAAAVPPREGTSTDEPERRRARTARWVRGVLAILLFFGVSVGLQIAGRAFQGELVGYPDEAAHYVTGLMVHDYLASGFRSTPMEFAVDYYLHYPKVALGHWPPLFYAVQAVWMLVFSPSKMSVLLLMALLAAGGASALHWRASRYFGWRVGLAMGCLYLALPIVQEHTAMVMAEGLLTLVCFLAATFFGRYLDSEAWRDCAWYGVFTCLAVLTKGNGWALALVPPIALLVTRRWHLLARRPIWLTAAGVLAFCAPWQLLTLTMVQHGWTSTEPSLRYTAAAMLDFLRLYAQMAGLLLFCMAILGLAATILLPARSGQPVGGEWAAAFGLVVAAWLFHAVVPAGVEPRKLMMAAPSLLLLMAAGAAFLCQRLGAARRWAPAAVLATLTMAFGLEAFAIPVKQHRGLDAAAQGLLSRPDMPRSVFLVSADASGEGAFVAEVAMRDRRPNHYVLRATKLLSQVGWAGGNYRSLYGDPDAVRRCLEAIPVHVIVLDGAPGLPEMRHHALLARMVAERPEEWIPVPVQQDARPVPGGGQVKIYRRAHPVALPAGGIAVDVESMLSPGSRE